MTQNSQSPAAETQSTEIVAESELIPPSDQQPQTMSSANDAPLEDSPNSAASSVAVVAVEVQPAILSEEVVQISGSSPTSISGSGSGLVEDSANSVRSGRIVQYLQVIQKITKWIWIAVIVLVVIPLIGKYFIARAFEPPIVPSVQPERIEQVAPSYNWDRYEQDTKAKLRIAHDSARDFASKELDGWVETLSDRIDDSFLDWYFGYFNQKQIEYNSFFTGIVANFQHWLDPTRPTAQERIAEVITEEFQTEFAKRVLMPQTSQLRLENIGTQTAKHYLRTLQQEFNQIPIDNNISATDWQRYLRETAIDIPGIDGRMNEMTLQKLTTAGVYAAFKPAIVPFLPKIGSAVTAKLLGKAGAKIATKTGTVVSAKLGGALLDATVGVGILLWDIWDNNHTAAIEKPILRSNLIEYLQQVKESVLDNPENGVMSIIDRIDQTILRSIHIARDMDSSLSSQP